MRRLALALALVLTLAAFAGWAGWSATASPTGSGGLPLKQDGVLTVGAEFPAQGFLNLPRSHPTGFEADVANAIAKRLKIGKVKWVETPFTSLFSPAPKKFDFDINEITITAERKKVVDFSVPYFDANQAVFALRSSAIAKARRRADLKQFQLGGQATTTGLDYIKKQIKPSKKPREYSTTGAAAQAVVVKQIDGFVIDVPIAAALAKQYKKQGGTVLGQFITNEQYGILFEKGNRLRSSVDKAIRALKADGTLRKLQVKWFPEAYPLRVFK